MNSEWIGYSLSGGVLTALSLAMAVHFYAFSDRIAHVFGSGLGMRLWGWSFESVCDLAFILVD